MQFGVCHDWVLIGVDNCHYLGHLANEPEACVAVTGCIGSEDVDFTILSAHSTRSSMFKWTKEGLVEVVNQEVSMIDPIGGFYTLAILQRATLIVLVQPWTPQDMDQTLTLIFAKS